MFPQSRGSGQQHKVSSTIVAAVDIARKSMQRVVVTRHTSKRDAGITITFQVPFVHLRLLEPAHVAIATAVIVMRVRCWLFNGLKPQSPNTMHSLAVTLMLFLCDPLQISKLRRPTQPICADEKLRSCRCCVQKDPRRHSARHLPPCEME